MLAKLSVMGEPDRLRLRGKLNTPSFNRVSSMAYLNQGVFIDLTGSQVILGDELVIEDGVRIMTHTHQFEFADWRERPEIHAINPTIIEDYVFIGIDAIIMPSCKYIGKHSVVGAGAVVTKNVPDYEIWAGNPAKRIKDVKNVQLRLCKETEICVG